jgi:hypothetical protein
MKKFILIFAVSAIFIISCKPTVENEQKSWNDNLQKMSTLKSTYPAFASFIDSKIAAAKTIWSQAEGISDKDQKAKKMSEANDIFETGCVYQLSEMKDKMRNVDNKISDVKDAKRGEKGTDKHYANDAVDDAQQSLKEVGQILYNGKTTISSEPCEVISRAYALLTKSYDNLVSAQNKLSNKNSSNYNNNSNNSNSNNSKNSNNSNQSNKTNQSPAKIKCEYCGTMNDATATKCSSCGAPLKK